MTRQITGKAMMLDEIINYVQSLQRQVEVSVLKTCDLEVYSLLNDFSRPMAESSFFMFVLDSSVPFDEALSDQTRVQP
jgi:hypothetical protein